MKGYQIIEPKALHPLFSNPVHHVFAVAIMSWLCEIMRVELQEHIEHVDFNVICVTYMGSYPAIGIQYKNQEYQDIAPLVEVTIDRILTEKSILELTGFIGASKPNWKDVAANKLNSTRQP